MNTKITNIILRITFARATKNLQIALKSFTLFCFQYQKQQNDMRMLYSQAASSSFSESSCLKAPDNVPTPSHTAIHWSACFNKRCNVHIGDKEQANWFPKQPRRSQPRWQAKKVNWDEPEGLGSKYDNLEKFVEELQERRDSKGWRKRWDSSGMRTVAIKIEV